jgi:hypothetical protein
MVSVVMATGFQSQYIRNYEEQHLTIILVLGFLYSDFYIYIQRGEMGCMRMRSRADFKPKYGIHFLSGYGMSWDRSVLMVLISGRLVHFCGIYQNNYPEGFLKDWGSLGIECSHRFGVRPRVRARPVTCTDIVYPDREAQCRP